MKIAIIGLGSMGKRRIKLIKKLNKSCEIIGVEAREDRREEAAEDFGLCTYSELDACIEDAKPQAAFVCTSPLAHYEIIQKCLRNGISVFSEINLINENHDALIALAEEKRCTLFLSSTPMYRGEILQIGEAVAKFNGSVNYQYHVGQYLPDWHPWESFHDFFVGDKRTNGCREIFAIELPWMIETFGRIKAFHVVRSKISKLNIDFCDSYLLTVEHEGGASGVICFDVVTHPATRRLEVYGDGIKILWDGRPDQLKLYNSKTDAMEYARVYDTIESNPNYDASIIENAYADEIKSFFEVMEGRGKAKYSFEKDKEVLKLIDEIEGRNQ